MKKILILICLIIAIYLPGADKPNNAVAAKTAASAVAKPKPKVLVDLNLNPKDVMGILNNFNMEIVKSVPSKPITGLRIYVFRNKVKDWLDYPFLESDSEINRDWFVRVHKLLDYMAKIRSLLEDSVCNRQTNSVEYKKMEGYFKDAHKQFAELLKKPTPGDEKRMDKLRELKKKWESEKRRAEAKKKGVNLDE